VNRSEPHPELPTSRASGRLGKYLRDARTLPSDIRIALRVEGWPGVWTELAERTLRRAYRAGRFVLVEQDAVPADPSALPAGVEVRSLPPADAGTLAGIATERTLSLFRRRFAAGRECIAAYRRQRPIGWGWYSERVDADVEPYGPPLPSGCVYLWDGYVAPSERGQGVGGAVIRARIELARRRGALRTWQLIRPENRASMRALERAGKHPVRVLGELGALRVVWWKRERFRWSSEGRLEDLGS
jgi:GNAT superfamily N-acetyltransferase